MQLFILIIGILLFIGLVLVHEWGHFIVARRNGVKAEEFGLGFPPRAWSKRLKSGLLISLNWLPIGGFVKLKGENDSDERKGSLGAASLWAKAKIMLAGVTMNLITGLLLLTVLAWLGMPKLINQENVGQDQFTVASDTHITHQSVLAGAIIDGTPASAAGLKSSDTIVSISGGAKSYDVKTTKQLHDATTALAGQPVTIFIQKSGSKQLAAKRTKLMSLAGIVADLKKQASLSGGDKVVKVYDPLITKVSDRTEIVKSDQDFYNAALDYSGQKVTLTYISNGQTKTKATTLNPKAYLGISPTQLQIQRSTWSAPIVAIGLTKQVIVLTFEGIGHALGGLGSTIAGGVTGNSRARQNGQSEATSQVGGPVAIGVGLWDSAGLGINFMLFLIALLSLTLALMNILPIPALDGGRLTLMLVSRGIFRRPLTRSAEERIVGTSFALLMLLVILITVVDVKRF